MSILSLAFPTQSHLIQIFYNKPKHRRQLLMPSKLQIVVSKQSHMSDTRDKNVVELTQDYCFRNFESLGDFYKYVSKNKKKDILSVDPRGYISIKVLEGKKEIDTETINLPQKKSYIVLLENICDDTKTKQIKKPQKHERISELQQQQQVHELSFSIVGKEEKYRLHQHNLSAQFPTTFQNFKNKGLQIKINRLRSDMAVIFQVKYSLDENVEKHQCPFGRGYEFSLQLDDGDIIQLSYGEGQIAIMNTNNNNGKIFDSNLRDQAENINKQLWISVRLRPHQ